MKVLLVEDEALIIRLWLDYLTPLGVDVEVASTFREMAEEMRKIPPPDLVMLDLVLPDSLIAEDTLRSGVEMINRLNPSAVVVVITGMSSLQIAEVAHKIGADGFNLKTQVNSQESLWKAVRSALGKRMGSSREKAEGCIDLVGRLDMLLRG